MPDTTKLTPPVFSVHSLLFNTHTNPRTLQEMARVARQHGDFGLEVAFHPDMIDYMDVMSLGAVCVAEQVPITALCVFFGKGDFDPLSSITNQEKALQRLRCAADFASTIGEITGITPLITGPWAYQIAKPYPRDDSSLASLSHFVSTVDRQLDESHPQVRRALEVLRPQENFAIQGHCQLLKVLSGLGPNTGVHLDTFHMQLWGDDSDPKQILRMFGEKLFWFHVSGQDRRTPGSHQDEHIDWRAWVAALNANPVKPGLCFEGFGPAFRNAVPEIGNGFPTDLTTERSIMETLQTLRQAGLSI